MYSLLHTLALVMILTTFVGVLILECDDCLQANRKEQ
jgi:hypothetical protein